MAEDKQPDPAASADAVAEVKDEAQPAEQTQTAPSKDGRPLMSIKVYAPFKVYYEGEGYSLTAVNETGPFDVLPHHRNFLCMLVPCDLLIKTPYEDKTVKISRALMHVKADKVTVYLDV